MAIRDKVYLALVVVCCFGVSEHLLRLVAHYVEGDQNSYSVFALPAHIIYWTGVLDKPAPDLAGVHPVLAVFFVLWFVGTMAVFASLLLYIAAKFAGAIIRWTFGTPVRTPTAGQALGHLGLGIVAFSSVVTWSFHYSIPAPLLLILDVIGISLALEGLRREQRRYTTNEWR